jgi:hypothetical protein
MHGPGCHRYTGDAMQAKVVPRGWQLRNLWLLVVGPDRLSYGTK